MSRFLPHIALLFALVCNAAANILIKYSMSRASASALDAGSSQSLWSRVLVFLNPVYLLALTLFGLNLVAYSFALRTFKISIAYPIMISGGYCLIVAVGWFLFHERLSLTQVSGIGLILAGIWLVVR